MSNGHPSYPPNSTHPHHGSTYYANGGQQPWSSNVQPGGGYPDRSSPANSPSPGGSPYYRPRPSPVPSSGGKPNICEHGSPFPCPHGCHKNMTPNGSPSPGNSPNSCYSPSSSGMSRHSSPLSNPPMSSNQVHGYPTQANLPNRMAPGPSVEGPDPNAMYYAQSSGPPPTFSMMPPSLPNGQPGYASLPNRMTPGPCTDSASDATRSARRRAPNS